MILTPAQNIIARDNHRFRIVNCGRRFGKTTLSIEEIKGMALGRAKNIAYVAPTYQQARDIVWEQLKTELRSITISTNEQRLEIRVRSFNEKQCVIVLRGWESIETLRGQHYDFIVLDEVASMRNFWLNWQEVIRPTLTDTKGEALFISTPKGFNHFYDLYNFELKDADYKSFHFTSYDNPHIPAEEIDKAKQELTEDRFAQEYLADFRKTEGLVYKEFSRDKHLYSDAIINKSMIMGGLDFGHTNPCGLVTVIKDFDNHYWVTDEYYERGKTESEIAEYVKACNLQAVYPDPENPSAITELRRKGVNVRDVIKGDDSIRVGINKVRELFKTNRLHIHNSCVNLIYELETYSYPEKKDMRNEDEDPIKENDHLCDALRYLIMMQNDGNGQATQFYPTHKSTVHYPTRR
jgi:PBSX family phage terminase large subunit